MRGEVDIGQRGQIDILVATPFGRVAAKQADQAHGKLQESARNGVEVEFCRLKRCPSFRVEGWVGGFFKGQHRGLVDVDMIRVAISTNWIKGKHDFRF